jgi:hypothetical protein
VFATKATELALFVFREGVPFRISLEADLTGQPTIVTRLGESRASPLSVLLVTRSGEGPCRMVKTILVEDQATLRTGSFAAIRFE